MWKGLQSLVCSLSLLRMERLKTVWTLRWDVPDGTEQNKLINWTIITVYVDGLLADRLRLYHTSP